MKNKHHHYVPMLLYNNLLLTFIVPPVGMLLEHVIQKEAYIYIKPGQK